jgi:hypothetical protein
MNDKKFMSLGDGFRKIIDFANKKYQLNLEWPKQENVKMYDARIILNKALNALGYESPSETTKYVDFCKFLLNIIKDNNIK